MQFSKEAIACLVCVFDRLHSRSDNMCQQVQAGGNWRCAVCSRRLIRLDADVQLQQDRLKRIL